MRALLVDLLLSALPIAISLALLFVGMRVFTMRRRLQAAAIIGPMCAVALLVVSAKLAPEQASRMLAMCGGTTVALCALAVFLIGVAWGAPGRAISPAILGTIVGISICVIAMQASAPLYWRFFAQESWKRFPDETGSLRQSSGTTCAAAAAAMMLHALGVRVSEGEIAYLAGTSLLGTDAEALVTALERRVPADLQVQLLREWPNFGTQPPTPFVIFVGGSLRGHALCVRYLQGDEIEVVDPLDGTRSVTTRDQLDARWDRIAIVVVPRGGCPQPANAAQDA